MSENDTPEENIQENPADEVDSLTEQHSVQIIEPNKSKVFKPTSSEVDKLMSQLVNLNEKRIYHEPTCPICSSPYREDMERDFTDKKDYARAKAIVHLDIGDIVIENHMSNHHARGVKEIQKLEYANRISRLNKSNPSTLDKIQLCSSMLLERMVEVNSISPNSSLSVADVEKIKSSETARLSSVFNNLMKLQASIMGEMKTSGELITIPVDEFVRVFNDALTSSRTDSEREMVKNILDKLSKVNKGG